jgi:hypothetical protein
MRTPHRAFLGFSNRGLGGGSLHCCGAGRLKGCTTVTSDAGVQDHKDAAKEQQKQKIIAQKMKALEDKINKDFHKVTAMGKSAGYLQPIKMPHV